ncbi:MAG: NADPH-dependent F420 reductase [Acidimicrobiales bacterium]
MRVGIIGGTGPAGMGLALRLAAAGAQVTVGSRTAERAAEKVQESVGRFPGLTLDIRGALNEEAAQGEIVVMATPWDAAVATGRSLAQPLAGKVVVSMANALMRVGDEFQPLIPARGSVAESLQAALEGSHVGAAFHHVPARLLGNLDHEMDCDVLVCADRPEAVEQTERLVAMIPGLRPVVAGTLSLAGAIESFTGVLLNINVRHKARAGIKLTGL